MTAPPDVDRMFAALPAIFRAADDSGDLARLLAPFQALLFGDPPSTESADPRLPGLEGQLYAIVALFAPLGDDTPDGLATPPRFLHWLANWLAFTPHALFAPPALRRIVAGIVPMHGLRGTRAYLVRLVELCFDEVVRVDVDDRPRVGFQVGLSALGTDTRLAQGRPWSFRVAVDLARDAADAPGAEPLASLQHRLRAVIDFAKPAHTVYDLRINLGGPARGASTP